MGGPVKYLSGVVTLRYDPRKCSGCGRCLEVCPRAVFVINGGKARVTDPDLCMECGACMNNCPHGALEVRAGVGCAAALIHSMFRGGEPICGCADPADPAGPSGAAGDAGPPGASCC
jgi:NAD-dependent dihydropyrimidine dehydrogenase PreA subunit